MQARPAGADRRVHRLYLSCSPCLFELRPRCHRCAFQCPMTATAPSWLRCATCLALTVLNVPPPPQAYLRSIASHPLLQRSETLKVFLLQPGDLSRNPAWLMLSAAHAPKRFGEASSTLPMPTSLLAGRC